MKKLNPNLMVKSISDTVRFYMNILGFELVMAVPEKQDGMDTEIADDKKYVWAQVKNGNVEIMLQEVESLKQDVSTFSDSQIGASVTFYIETENIEEFFNEIKNKVEVIKELATSWYGMNEFYIRDNNGYVICFAEQAKE
jgi:uncharacterized glyoxalase superfamily protein PhnB